MNLLRTLPSRALYILQQICQGQIVLLWDEYHQCYVHHYTTKDGEDLLIYKVGRSKGRPGKRRNHIGGHTPDVLTDMWQRGILLGVDGRLMPCHEARRLFGTPPPLPDPPRTLKMSRTRAARTQ